MFTNTLFRVWEDRAEASSLPRDLLLGSHTGGGLGHGNEDVDKGSCDLRLLGTANGQRSSRAASQLSH